MCSSELKASGQIVETHDAILPWQRNRETEDSNLPVALLGGNRSAPKSRQVNSSEDPSAADPPAEHWTARLGHGGDATYGDASQRGFVIPGVSSDNSVYRCSLESPMTTVPWLSTQACAVRPSG